MRDREQRIAYNETLFRRANEQLLAARGTLNFQPLERTPFICECGDVRCTRVISLSLAEYESVRANPNTFALIPGHEDAGTESIVEDVVVSNERFAVVKKLEHVRSDTEASDPRR